MATLLNEEPFRHICQNGTIFTADRCDFIGGVTAKTPPNMRPERLMQDVAEMIGFHATNIHPDLSGFSGYGVATFKIVE